MPLNNIAGGRGIYPPRPIPPRPPYRPVPPRPPIPPRPIPPRPIYPYPPFPRRQRYDDFLWLLTGLILGSQKQDKDN